MRADTTASGPLVRLRATHLLLGVSAHQSGDALAVADGGALGVAPGPPRLVFVPSPLPCGECPYCRRALVSACLHLRVGMSLDHPGEVELPERFLTPISEPAWAALPSAALAAAGLAAELIDATARAGLGPGDTAIWVGDEPWISLGAAFSARRSCRTFRLGERSPSAAARPGPAPSSDGSEAVVSLEPNAGSESWAAIITAAEAASSSGQGRPERRIFIYSASPAVAAAALKLAAPGSTLCFQRGVPPSLGNLDRLAPLRILIGGGYHPDLVPEALAALARQDIDVLPAIHEVSVSSLAAHRASRDPRLPLITL